MLQIKKIIKDWIPPAIINIFMPNKKRQQFLTNYSNWNEAKKASGGYNSDIILDKVKVATLKVKDGVAAYEQDSVNFDSIQYSWPLLAGLMWVAAQNNNSLSLIDFGGSLGSTYYQNRKFLRALKKVQWNIVEQKKFVDSGKQGFENEELKFYYDIESCVREQDSNLLLCSGVIQYLQNPYVFLNDIMEFDFKFILFDRTSFSKKENDIITVQKMPSAIYDGSYPCWFLNLNKFRKILNKQYELIEEFESFDRVGIPSVFKGFIFKHKGINEL